ncbi:MAG: hypothetical protein RKR03_10495 [Candidatus Competibacter sp.]|nr:hypothetical protein [Candidatus Competibacter sp.]
MSDWLAVGDETGNWDELYNPGGFLGVALVVGRIEDWQKALADNIDGQSIQDRLRTPPRSLPREYQKSTSHHLLDAFNYWKDQRLSGTWSLAEPDGDPLRQEVFATLRWLAEHPRLITLGLWLKGPEMRRELFLSDDPAVALGRAYGLLVGLALPFLNPKDRLLVQPGLRTESANLPAKQRASLAKAQPNADARQHGDLRGTVSVLVEEGQRHRNAWRGGAIAGLEAGALDHLRGLCAPLKKAWLDNNVLNAVADLGAGLLRLSCQPGEGGLRLRRDDTWRNVVFHALPELHA